MSRAALSLLLAGLGCSVPAGGQGDPDCEDWRRISNMMENCPPLSGPTRSGQAVTASPAACSSASWDDPCVSCLKSSCCSEALACFADVACVAEMGSTYVKVALCRAARCAAVCTGGA